ncbi:transcriptional repressor LexA [Oceanospirillum linum]|uniref:transcriptional repressor LexA n=1 Tax=Oceanospirillum linum TaxID=966 RepID=UPI00089ECE66|nr:transcriptional repressor LexA [Oceanospirillum linum]SEF58619.1 repressor LexA [Oleiphilus messinensis]SMP06467.1 repressor LexA [Oceanospirillum linum]
MDTGKQKHETLFLLRAIDSQNHNLLWQDAVYDGDIAPNLFSEIPLLGWVTAGMPMEICENHEQIQVPKQLVKKNTYALKVRGNSMVEANIHDGDIIVIEQSQTVENGETCVVMINNQYVTLKRLYIDRTGVRLDPANSSMSPITLKNEDVQVLGIVMGLKRSHSLQ